jgi:hypothetical protein
MFAGCAFMEEGEGGRFVSLDLVCELASSYMLIFVLHDAL